MAGTSIGEVVAVDGGDDDVGESHPLRGPGQTQRLEKIWRPIRPPRMHVAVAAGAGAGVAQDLEGGGAAAPALGDVRAAGLLADRVQLLPVDERAHLREARLGTRRTHPHPLGRAARRRGAISRGSPHALVQGLRPEPAPASAGSCSRSSSKASSNDAVRSGRASATATGRPSSPATDVNVAVEAARGDPLGERGRIEVDVEGEAVRGHPARHVDADGGDLARALARYPDAGQAVDTLRVELEACEGLNRRLLEVAAVALDVLAVKPQVEDRIADELSRPMVGRAPPRSVSTTSASASSGRWSSSVVVRLPVVTVAGCSSRITVSGTAPCVTAAARERWRSHASRYGVSPSSR